MYPHLALSYRQWHYRMTTVWAEQPGGPAIGFSAFQCLNAFSLLMLIPPNRMPAWLFASIPLAVGAGAFTVVSHIYRAHPLKAQYAKLSDNVPGICEFPEVYAYLFCTFALLVVCLYVAVQRAA